MILLVQLTIYTISDISGKLHLLYGSYAILSQLHAKNALRTLLMFFFNYLQLQL